MRLKDLARDFLRVFSTDEGAPPGGSAAADLDVDLDAGAPTETTPATDTTTTSAPATLTAEEVEARAYAATQRAIRDAEREHLERQRQAPAHQQRQPGGQGWNPAGDALDMIDARNDLYEEALAMHPDLPKEEREQIKTQIRNLKTPTAIAAAKEGGMAQLLADAAYGRSVRMGKIAKGTVSAPRVEPTASEPVHRMSAGITAEIDEIERTLGITFTAEERREFA